MRDSNRFIGQRSNQDNWKDIIAYRDGHEKRSRDLLCNYAAATQNSPNGLQTG
jgi:hypothetical protein